MSTLVMLLPDRQKLDKFLEENSRTEYIRLHWVDYSGVLRTRFVPVDRCRQIFNECEDYLIPQVSMIIPVSTAPKCFPPGVDIEVLGLRPDTSSLRICGFKQNHASVMCFVENKNGPTEETYHLCPRYQLSHLLEDFEQDWGADRVQAGFEIEFMLLDHNFQPLNQLDRLNSYQTTAGLRGRTLDIVEEILEGLRKSSIKIHHFHTETHDQIEIALSPEPLLDAIDSFILAQEAIRTVFVKHNIRATMTPKPLLEGPTNGVHMHMSVESLTLPQTDSFLAGIVNHMRSLCAFGMANFDGYVRTARDAAGAWVGWGTENRDLPVRRITEHHWEFRMMDSTCNPYLFAAAVLQAGLSGLGQELELGKDCRVFPHLLNERGHPSFGLYEKMPTSLQEALESLKADEAMRWTDCEKLLDSYLLVKEKEVEVFEKMTEEERRLRFLEYF